MRQTSEARSSSGITGSIPRDRSAAIHSSRFRHPDEWLVRREFGRRNGLERRPVIAPAKLSRVRDLIASCWTSIENELATDDRVFRQSYRRIDRRRSGPTSQIAGAPAKSASVGCGSGVSSPPTWPGGKSVRSNPNRPESVRDGRSGQNCCSLRGNRFSSAC